MSKNLPGPCSERQAMYMFPERYAKDKDGNKLNIAHVDVVLFGGAAGSGKSEIGVIDFLKYTDIPNFIGIITRRTTPQLQGPGGLLTKCKRIFSRAYEPDEYVWRAKDGKFVFKSGAEIYLKHFENEQSADNWQGAEANLFYIDEASQYTQYMVQYIMSRMRNPSCPQVTPRLRMTCNPDNSHFLLEWVKPYLLEDGTPDRTQDGRVRYFSFYNGEFVWADTKEDLERIYGIEQKDALSFMFISANVFDNPIVQKVNPQYVSWLKGLKGVERARLLDGNWYVREEGSSFFDRTWVEEIDWVDESEVVKTVRAYDFAGSLKSDLNPSPDYTATCRMRLMKNGDYVIDHIARTRIKPGDWLEFVLQTCENDPVGTTIYIPEDPNPAAKRASMMFARDLADYGYYVKRMKTNKSKLDRFRPFSSQAQNGGVKVLKNCGFDFENKIMHELGFFYRELENFTGVRKRGENFHDDLCDVVSDTYYALASNKTQIANISQAMSGFANSMREAMRFPTVQT